MLVDSRFCVADVGYSSKWEEEKPKTDSSCLGKRERALRQSQEIALKLPGTVTNVTTIMIPRCKEDGSWQEVSLHLAQNMGYFHPTYLSFRT